MTSEEQNLVDAAIRTSESRENWLVYGSFVLYFLGWILGLDHLALALLSFGGAVAFALCSVPFERRDRREQQKSMALASLLFIGPALGTFYVKYQDQLLGEQFVAYLAKNRCVQIGEVGVFFEGGCDGYDNCVDGEVIDVPEYQCKVNGRSITYNDYKFEKKHTGIEPK